MYLKLLKVLMFASKQLFYVFLVQVVAMQLLLATNSNSQKLEEIFVDLAVENVSLQQLLDQISQKTNFTIGYETNLVNKDEKYTFVSKGENFELLLLEIAKKAEVKFKRINNKLLVSKDPRNIAEKKIEIILEVDISGKVTDENGEGLPGASVVIKGSATGTTTDFDGNYKLAVPSDATIIVSFVGYKNQEIVVGSQSVIDITMQVDAEQLEEVVVTALGIEKDAKALGYAVTQLDGKGFTEAREINVGNALTGKVAGVNVSNIASGPAGSTRVVIRGNSSISGNNQPLYVVDGVPIDNTTLGSAGQWGGKDWGDGLSSINPDDIESMTVLKGNSAGALYGSRASNGVILITTKKGKNRKGIGIELNSNFTFDKIINTYDDLQTEYGQGRLGLKPTTAEEALSYGKNTWGAKLDGSPVYQFDGVERPYSYVGNNINNFYNTGKTLSNTVSLTAGDETKNIRVSISDMDNTSVIPNSGMDRNTFTVSANGKFAKKLTLTTKIQYNIENVKNRPNLSDSPGNTNYSVANMPTNVDVRTLKGSTSKIGANADGTELGQNNNAFVNNPYWTAYQYETRDKRDRLIASGQMRYDFTDWLYLQGRVGTDWYTSRRRDLVPYGTNGSNGSLTETEIRQRETNAEFIFGMDKTFGDFRINSFFGGNRMRKSNERFDLSGTDFQVPFFHSITNFVNVQSNLDQGEVGINSLFGSAEVSYKNVLFLTMTGRNDWFSTLEPETNSVFYPSAALSFAFSDLMELPSWFTFGKVRTAWSEVGGAPLTPYRTNLTYNIVGGHQGASLGSVSSSEVPNRALRPLKVSEIEIGMDLRFFNDRLGLDIAYYDRKTTNDILSATLSNATGFSSAAVNIGEMTNKGVELLLRGTPVKGAFTWDVSFNYANNKNEVVKLADGLDVLVADQSRTQRAWIQHIVGQPFSSIVGYRQQRIDGQLVFGEFGGPFAKRDSETSILGKGVAPVTGGISNDFYYKNFNLSFLLGFQMGGSIHSGTNTLFYTNGLHEGTLAGRENGLSFTALNTEGISEDYVVTPEELEDYYWVQSNWITEYVVYSSDYVKLRSFVLGYTLPGKLIERTPFNSVNISFVGRNLWLIHSKTDNIDPESTYNNGNSQGLEYTAVPQSRSFGFNLSIKF
ncbi:SusC/RagA family TonB-linked outer membrane protein [Reichenbachiella sp. MALMAid0571]|uniref:SusC/RagA family TonB-linked outer membrane protein n=1 Tax=Reichenbachiella sp. MALMAid0571 TaxID=3143939 RepID=UPI0032E01CD9